MSSSRGVCQVRGRVEADREADIETACVCVCQVRGRAEADTEAAGEAVAKDQENDAFRVWCIARVIRSYVHRILIIISCERPRK